MNPNNEPSVIFESEKFDVPIRSAVIQTPKVIQLMVRYSGGIIKNEIQASYILVAFTLLVVATIFVFLFINSGGTKAVYEAPPGYKIVYPKDEPPRLEKLP